MLELNLRPLEQFENIYKNEHLRILENIKRVNSEICTVHDWDFLTRQDKCTLHKGEYDSCYETRGKVLSVWEGGHKLKYNKNFTDFFTGRAALDSYGVFNGRLIFQKGNKDRHFRVFYTIKAMAVDIDGVEKANFEAPTDVSLIPSPFAEDVLVYGTCTKTKANPGFAKFPYWNANYIRAIGRLRAECCITSEDVPTVRLERGLL